MRSLLLLLFALFAFNTGFSQQMNPDKLLEIMQRESDTLQVNGNSYQFIVCLLYTSPSPRDRG